MPDEPEPNYDPDSATIPMSGPRPTLSGSDVDLPLPEELTKLLPAGAYQITGFLGAGGMGAVYKGTQVRLKRPVAIKIMRRDMGRDHDFEARFEREAQAMAKLNHPNIISVIDFGEAGPDYLFIVMELVDGTDLMEVIRSKQMTQEMALSLLPQICDALQFAHDHGIVHRDIKPGNIMLTRDGRVKMADFGLAKHFNAVDSGFRTQTGTGMGTPDYAAPEQFDPTTPIDHRADIYALGVMIYQMVTGSLPRGAWKPPSEKSGVDASWDHIVARALQTDPHERYASVTEIKTDLGGITPVTGGPQLAPESTQDRKTAGMTTAKGSTTALTQAGGRPASKIQPPVGQKDAPPTTSSRVKAATLIVAAGVVLLAGGYFAWEKFKPAAPASTSQVDAGQPSYPRPQAWVDATDELRELVTVNQAGTWKDGWLQFSRPGMFEIAGGRVMRNAAVRATFTGSLALKLRHKFGGKSYQAEVDSSARLALFAWDSAASKRCDFSPIYRPLDPDALRAEHTIEFMVQDDRLVVWLDGRQMIEHSNDGIIEGAIGLDVSALVRWPEFAPRIKKVEYADLGGTAVGPAASQAVVSRTWTAPTPTVSASTEWTNLIPHIQPQRDVIRGGWRVDEKGLTAQRAEWALCSIPVKDPGTDYDLRYKVTRGEGSQLAMFFAFRKGSTGGYVPIDYIGGGAEFADGQRWATIEDLTHLEMRDAATPKAKRKEWFPRGKACTVLLQVREKEVIISVDDEEAFRWPADWSKLQQRGGAGGSMFLDVTGGPIFGVGIFNCEAVFHSIEMRRVGDAKPDAKTQPSASSPATATKGEPFVNTLGMKFLPVPITGGPTDNQRVLFSVWETRVHDYEVFVKEMKREWKKSGFAQGTTHPAVNMNCEDAMAFCAWLTETERKAGKLDAQLAYRLPSDHEWSCAVGIGDKEDAAKMPGEKNILIPVFPWGNQWPPPADAGNYGGLELKPLIDSGRLKGERTDLGEWQDSFVQTAPCGSFRESRDGLFDLGGNAFEWCNTPWSATSAGAIIRGGSSHDGQRERLFSSLRVEKSLDTTSANLGFRCVLAHTKPNQP